MLGWLLSLAWLGAEGRECYVTVVYGSAPKHVCAAVVLGAALRSMDASRPRVALVSNVSGAGEGALRSEWELAPSTWRGDAGRKVDLFAAPGGCERVMYLDADMVPLTGALEGLWTSVEPGAFPVSATRQGRPWENYKHYAGCFNGGLLLVERDRRIYESYVKYTKTYTRQRGSFSKVDPRQRIGTKSIPSSSTGAENAGRARVATSFRVSRCHGTDQGFLNLAVGPTWNVLERLNVAFLPTCAASHEGVDVVHAGRGGFSALLAYAKPPTIAADDWCARWWAFYDALSGDARAYCEADGPDSIRRPPR